MITPVGRNIKGNLRAIRADEARRDARVADENCGIEIYLIEGLIG